MGITRRSFLKLLASVAAIGIPAPLIAKQRDPYVKVGDVVDWVGQWGQGFIGGQVVHEIGPWNGSAYPVYLWNNAYGSARMLEVYRDCDLANMRAELPDKFWHNPDNRKYPNAQSYIRVQRFGETIDQAAKTVMFSYKSS